MPSSARLSSSKKEASVKRADDFSESPNSEKERIIDAYNYNMGIDPNTQDEEKSQKSVHPHKSSLWVRLVKGLFILSQFLLFALSAMLSYALILGVTFLGAAFPFFIGSVFILAGMVFVFTFGTYCVSVVDRKCTLIVLFIMLMVIAGQVFILVSSSDLKPTASDDTYTEYWDSLSNDKRVSFQKKASCCGFDNSTDRAGDPCPDSAANDACSAYIDSGLDFYHQNSLPMYSTIFSIEALSLVSTLVLVYGV